MNCIYLCDEIIKITGMHFSYNKEKTKNKNSERLANVSSYTWRQNYSFENFNNFKKFFSFIDIKSLYRSYKWARKNAKETSKPKIKKWNLMLWL